MKRINLVLALIALPLGSLRMAPMHSSSPCCPGGLQSQFYRVRFNLTFVRVTRCNGPEL